MSFDILVFYVICLHYEYFDKKNTYASFTLYKNGESRIFLFTMQDACCYKYDG